MPSSSKQKSGADAMSEYHRDRATYHTSTIVQGPRKQFGSWNGNKFVHYNYLRIDYTNNLLESERTTIVSLISRPTANIRLKATPVRRRSGIQSVTLRRSTLLP